MTQNELRRFLAKYKPKTLYTQKTDAIKNNKPIVVNPVKYKPKADETVINLPGQKPLIVRRRNEVVSTDNRSNAQRRLDWKKDNQTRQYYQLLKNSLAFEEGVNAMTKLISPSTYAGAAARSLTGDGTFGSNLTSGTGFNDPIANIAFDVATPIALRSLQNPISKLFNSYETLNNTGREALSSVLRWQAKHPIFNRTILPPNQAGHFYRVGSSPMGDTLNLGKIVRKNPKSNLSNLYKFSKKLMDNPFKWQLANDEDLPYKNVDSNIINEWNPLGMLAKFGMMWDPHANKIRIHDAYDFPKYTKISIPERKNIMFIRGSVPFDPRYGSDAFNGKYIPKTINTKHNTH